MGYGGWRAGKERDGVRIMGMMSDAVLLVHDTELSGLE